MRTARCKAPCRMQGRARRRAAKSARTRTSSWRGGCTRRTAEVHMRDHEIIDWDDEPTRRTSILNDARVLIAEDDDALREMMMLQLLEEGCNVTEASDGDQALETIRDHDGGPGGPFDLVVLDVRMPGTSGLDVVRR